MAGVWTAERRAAQAARARADKPWMKSTGPKSADGKARVARNAVRTGWYAAESRAEMREIRALFRSNRALVAEYRAMIALDKAQRRAEKRAVEDRRKEVRAAAKAKAVAGQARKQENPKNKVKPPCWDRGLPGRKLAEPRYMRGRHLENKVKAAKDHDRPGREPVERNQNVQNKLKTFAFQRRPSHGVQNTRRNGLQRPAVRHIKGVLRAGSPRSQRRAGTAPPKSQNKKNKLK